MNRKPSTQSETTNAHLSPLLADRLLAVLNARADYYAHLTNRPGLGRSLLFSKLYQESYSALRSMEKLMGNNASAAELYGSKEAGDCFGVLGFQALAKVGDRFHQALSERFVLSERELANLEGRLAQCCKQLLDMSMEEKHRYIIADLAASAIMQVDRLRDATTNA